MTAILARHADALKDLPPTILTALWFDATVLTVRRGRTVMSIGTRSEHVYLLLEGRLQVTLYSVGGREVILRELHPGAILGEVAAVDRRSHSATVVATSDAVLASVTADAFRSRILAEPANAEWLIARLAYQVRDLTDRVFELNALRVRSRLHCELLRMCGTAAPGPGEVVIAPSPTHSDLAARVGTHREAVTREMRFLTEEGIVRQQGRRLTICRQDALARLVHRAGGFASGNGGMGAAGN